jgi:hypothetical protein
LNGPADGKPQPPSGGLKELLGAFRQVSSLASMVSLFVAGVILSFVSMGLGAPLAMMVAMYVGNTEPMTPHAGYPWGVAGAALAVWIFGLFLEYRVGRVWLGVVLSHVGAVAFVFAPILHLYRLWLTT